VTLTIINNSSVLCIWSEMAKQMPIKVTECQPMVPRIKTHTLQHYVFIWHLLLTYVIYWSCQMLRSYSIGGRLIKILIGVIILTRQYRIIWRQTSPSAIYPPHISCGQAWIQTWASTVIDWWLTARAKAWQLSCHVSYHNKETDPKVHIFITMTEN
jgi:hypothetical protein